MDAPERALLAETIRRVTDDAGAGQLDAALSSLGWTDALRADPAAAVAVLFAAQGAANASSSALDEVLRLALGGTLATGVVLPALGSTDPPGLRRHDDISIRGLGTAALENAATVVVVTADPDRDGARRAVTLETAGLGVRPVHGIDPALGLSEIAADVTVAKNAGEALEPGTWEAALALGHLALGFELAGAGRTMLELARCHALERVQFGQPIAAFQAVRHRLAESLVALEAADALLAAAESDGDPTNAAMAKALAGRAARTVAGHAQQVLAGIGFTTEHPLHRYVRRVLVLDQLLGAGDELTRRLGSDMLAGARLPPALAL